MSNPSQAFCTFVDWQPYLPPELRSLPERTWLARSRARNWCPYVKINGQRSAAFYKKTEVVREFRVRFSAVYPNCLDSLLASPAFKDIDKMLAASTSEEVRDAAV